MQEIDPNLGFIHLPIGEGCWAITEKWGLDDKRRSMIRAGTMPPNGDFDVLAYAPEGATADDALALLLKHLQAKVTEAPAYNELLNKVIANNRLQAAKNTEQTREFAREITDANSGKIISRGAGFSVIDSRVIGTPVIPRRGLTKSERDAQRAWSDR